MYTGKVPFPGTNITTVFPLILNRKIDWPENVKFDPHCKDLIEKLLQLEPEDRLGCRDTANDMNALKAHPFFEGIDFNYQLIDMGVRELLEASEPSSATRKQTMLVPNEVENSKFIIPENG